ncbi:hypothetical protein GF359_07170 [candidate division WOR-3 bacterium]|uniref:PKD/Chitinase domain-containing protein n=1 Tax=candidate division WOR-3 bacterium TaxID=2052148 RepID=A0A9D5QEF0_UNCW3|nr:hypothetical protein [candidate division WOR-3 bacterium]MBD3364980.1 hypothetical protein [candidate division WOR-3 bacterium]
MKRITAVPLVIVIIIGLSTCDENQPPSVPEITSTDTLIESEGQVLLEASSEDPDGDFINWLWKGEGSFNSTTDAAVAWIAPEVPDTHKATLTVTADDGKGGRSSASTDITVTPREITGDTFDVVIGIGEDFRDLPFYYTLEEDFYRFQVLYPGSEIDSSGRITQISVMSPSDVLEGSFHSFRIYMVEVERYALSTSFEDNYEGEQARLVYQTQSITYPETGDEWFNIELANPFTYDPGKNLLIEFYWKGSTGVSVPTYGYQTTCSRSNGSEFEDAVDGNPLQWALYLKLGFER